MLRPTEPEKTVCTCQGNEYCSLCGRYSRSIAFKGGYVCENCIDYIHRRI